MDITIRLEQEPDYRHVEELTREAFWNVHVPGCSEHLLAHNLRKCPAFMPDLDFVVLQDDQIVGNIMFCRSVVQDDQGSVSPVITFGPLSVLPAFQKRGIAASLVRHALQAAAGLGYGAVLIYGDPAYYHRFGFRSAQEFGIGTSDGTYMDALMALELSAGALDGISGRFVEGEAYSVNEEELMEFEKTFPHKEKCVTESQKRFQELSGM
jgi:putative acetyltransferase